MKLFNKIAIVGVGLIGGSMALAIKKKKIASSVIGVSRHQKSITFAKKIKAIDCGAKTLGIIKDADLVILATPISTILAQAKAIARIIKPGCVVTDVGSTKDQIVRKLEKLFPDYVGSHPLAGSQKRSIFAAQPDIFRGTLCILTPTRRTKPQVTRKIERLWQALGAKVVILAPALHDRILSLASHLPHIAAFSLIGVIPEEYLKFASTGLKDTTRIASSDIGIWEDVFTSNKKNILSAIDLLQQNLTRLKLSLRQKDRKALRRILKEAKLKRELLG